MFAVSSEKKSLKGPRVLAVTLVIFALTQCRLMRERGGDGSAREAAEANASGASPDAGKSGSKTEDGLDRVVWVSASRVQELVQEVRGYDVTGEVRCLPMKDESRCLVRPNPVREQCATQQGAVRRCDDCREICDKPLPPR